jgi:hypothetical protein
LLLASTIKAGSPLRCEERVVTVWPSGLVTVAPVFGQPTAGL